MFCRISLKICLRRSEARKSNTVYGFKCKDRGYKLTQHTWKAVVPGGRRGYDGWSSGQFLGRRVHSRQQLAPLKTLCMKLHTHDSGMYDTQARKLTLHFPSRITHWLTHLKALITHRLTTYGVRMDGMPDTYIILLWRSITFFHHFIFSNARPSFDAEVFQKTEKHCLMFFSALKSWDLRL